MSSSHMNCCNLDRCSWCSFSELSTCRFEDKPFESAADFSFAGLTRSSGDEDILFSSRGVFAAAACPFHSFGGGNLQLQHYGDLRGAVRLDGTEIKWHIRAMQKRTGVIRHVASEKFENPETSSYLERRIRRRPKRRESMEKAPGPMRKRAVVTQREHPN